ncbi:Ig-like domain-containing protein [Blautia schinkii]|nr:Ig-like domain-containing protein [Blautia schinkii]
MKKLKKLLCSGLLALLVISICGMPLIPNSVVEVQAATVKVATPKLVSAKASDTSKVKFTWKKVNGATGYKIYRKTDKSKWKAIKTISNGKTATFNDAKLKPGTQYYYSVSAYKKVNGKNVYGKYNTKGVYAITGLATPKLQSVTLDEELNLVDIYWKPVPGAHGYEILRKTKDTSWEKIGTETTCYFFDVPMQGGEFFYTVRAYCKYSGKTIKSNYNKNGLNIFVEANEPSDEPIEPPENDVESCLRVYWWKMAHGDSFSIKKENDNREISWKSSDPSIASVNQDGIVSAIRIGDAKITGTVENTPFVCDIYVRNAIEVDSTNVRCVTLTPVKVYGYADNMHVTYHIADTDIVRCEWKPYDVYGNYWILYIYPEECGSTTIEITNTYNNDTILLNVTVPEINIDVPVSSLFYNDSTQNVLLLNLSYRGRIPISLDGIALLYTDNEEYKMRAFDEDDYLQDIVIRPGDKKSVGFVTLDFEDFTINEDSDFVYSITVGNQGYMIVIKPGGRLVDIAPLEDYNHGLYASALSNNKEYELQLLKEKYKTWKRIIGGTSGSSDMVLSRSCS